MDLVEIARQGLYLVLLCSAPPLLACLVAGLLSGLLQAVTQVKDSSLSLVPRTVAVLLALALAAPWIGEQIATLALLLWQGLHRLG